MHLTSIIKTAVVLTLVSAAPTRNNLNHHKHERNLEEGVTIASTAYLEPKKRGLDLVEGNEYGLEVAAINSVQTTLQTVTLSSNTVIQTSSPVAVQSSQEIIDTVATSSSSSSSSSSSTSASSSSTASSSGSAAGAKGITYSPYASDGSCKSQSEVASDIALLKDYSVIRLYGVDCSQVENVLQAKGSNQKLFLGIYYMDQIEAGVETIANAISSYGSWDDVYTVAIGNELVNSGEATVSQIGSYVSTGRSALTNAGYTGKVVSVDTFIAVINNPGLCEYSDYIAVNAHAYFDYYTTAANAGPWVLSQIQNVWNACNGAKDVLVVESGWPSQGDTYGVAIPSKENQRIAITSIKESCGDATILFTAYNDLWKADGSYGVEKYWGIYSDN